MTEEEKEREFEAYDFKEKIVVLGGCAALVLLGLALAVFGLAG